MRYAYGGRKQQIRMNNYCYVCKSYCLKGRMQMCSTCKFKEKTIILYKKSKIDIDIYDEQQRLYVVLPWKIMYSCNGICHRDELPNLPNIAISYKMAWRCIVCKWLRKVGTVRCTCCNNLLRTKSKHYGLK